MVIFWRGWGFLGVALPVICAVVISVLLGDFGDREFAIGILASAAPLWVIGRRLNGGVVVPTQPDHEPPTMAWRLQAHVFETGFVENLRAQDFGAILGKREQHSMMFIRLEVWGLVYLPLSGVFWLIAIVSPF